MRIRPATEADWPAIWAFFDEIVQAQESYVYPLDLTSETARELWMMKPPGQTVVLEEEGLTGGSRILGSATMGPNKAGPGDHIGTGSFMVDGVARGKGVGRRLGEYVVQWHREQGYHGIQFNAVVETNTAAVRLWQALGFEIVGTVPETFRSQKHGLVGLHVMYLRLI